MHYITSCTRDLLCWSAEHPLSRSCPYLDTIDRTVLDFDFEKLCSVSLTNNNVYACLVCGKYFQGEGYMYVTSPLPCRTTPLYPLGRGQHSHAYTHSVQVCPPPLVPSLYVPLLLLCAHHR